jgi:hypothetical protein
MNPGAPANISTINMSSKFRPKSLSPDALKQWDEAEAAIEASMQRIKTLMASSDCTPLVVDVEHRAVNDGDVE